MMFHYNSRTKQAQFWVEDELVLEMDDMPFDKVVAIDKAIRKAFSKGLDKGLESAEKMIGDSRSK